MGTKNRITIWIFDDIHFLVGDVAPYYAAYRHYTEEFTDKEFISYAENLGGKAWFLIKNDENLFIFDKYKKTYTTMKIEEIKNKPVYHNIPTMELVNKHYIKDYINNTEEVSMKCVETKGYKYLDGKHFYKDILTDLM